MSVSMRLNDYHNENEDENEKILHIYNINKSGLRHGHK